MGDNRDGLVPRPSVSHLPMAASLHTPVQTGPVLAATPGKRAARVSHRTAAERVDAATRPYSGRRVANRPVDAPSGVLAGGLDLLVREPAPRRTDALDTGAIATVLAGLEPVDQTTSFADEVTAQIPLLRLQPAVAPSAPVTAGKRRATKHSGRRAPLFRGLPSAPLLLGLTALAISAGGAVTLGDTELVDATPGNVSHAASALTGTSGVATVGAVRGGTTSRSAARAAVGAPQDAAAQVVEERNAVRSESLDQVEGQAEKRDAFIEKNQWQVPLDSYRLTARFGQYGLWSSYHTGLDFAAPSGTPIRAIANGVVTSTGYDGSYGNKTVITLEDGTELWFCHQTGYAVSTGDTVRGGDLIGYVGSTGNVTGPHVHIEVRPGGGDPIDPYAAFVEHGVTP